ncbi:MAG: PIG-L family deacetylase [Roseiflexus sp.]|nr:PIG-L family deacetylase [Roseiflexus sp.]MCS7288176.1 PIG-L family deacetylase [Roseiflexus sp.]MDW8145984.1 PIG-L family deacetylase [Roseiflexaceae bacterium]MDW8232999.1 PIG-L family deacetylase [Roseiflexaceae bacterium]
MTARLIDLGADLTRYTRVYLSPHLDDAALSCGGAIAAAPGRTLVITLCTAPPPPGAIFSAVALEFHAEWGLAPDEALHVRWAEDAAAMAILGVDYVYAGWLDAIYRLPDVYCSRAMLYRPPVPDDPVLPQARNLLRMLIECAPHATVYAPLGVGNHVDHLAVFEATVACPPDRIAFYDDVNYALTPGAVEQRLAAIGKTLVAELVPFGTTALRTKIAAIAAYRSQMAALFGGTAAMEAAISAYHATLAQDRGGYAERIWRIM